jgi:transposase InsO family protein
VVRHSITKEARDRKRSSLFCHESDAHLCRGRHEALAQQNAHIERCNRTVRHEWPDQFIIESIEEAQDHATQWLWAFNNDRPNMGIGGITPARKLKLAA